MISPDELTRYFASDCGASSTFGKRGDALAAHHGVLHSAVLI